MIRKVYLKVILVLLDITESKEYEQQKDDFIRMAVMN